MEVVIPPRDHGSLTYKYAWDENGEVTTIQRVGGGNGRTRQTRQTLQWPFESISVENNSLPPLPLLPGSEGLARTEADVATPPEAHLHFRPATWQPRNRIPRPYDEDEDENSAGAIRRSLIPDYVINYLRGETPETVAQRKAERQQQKRRQEEPPREDDEGEEDPERRGSGEPRLRGGGSSEVDRQMPSPGYRLSDEPILPNNFFDEKQRRRSLGPGQQKRRQGGGRRNRHGFVAQGWRSGVILHALLASLVFLVGLTCLILASTQAKRHGAVAVVYASDDGGTSSCYAANRVGLALRALLAIVTIAVLAGAQYVFQVLSSPTRAEVDDAHSRRCWLDIGVPSLRNIAFLLRHRKSPAWGPRGSGRSRAVLALVVLVAALVSAVLYGGLVFVTMAAPLASAPDYDVLLVTPSFLQGAPFSNGTSNNAGGLNRLTILKLQQLAASTNQPQPLRNLTAGECLQKQSSAQQRLQQELLLFQIDDGSTNDRVDPGRFEAVLVVLRDAAVTALGAANSSVVQTAPAGSELLASDPSESRVVSPVFTIQDNVVDIQGQEDRSALVMDGPSVAFCLVQENAEDDAVDGSGNNSGTCEVNLNTPLLGGVVVLNLVTVLCFGLVLLRKSHRHFRHAPLITLGDAVASFLREPDPTTRGACLLSKRDVWNGRWAAMAGQPEQPQQHQQHQQQQAGNHARRDFTQPAPPASMPENIMQPMFLTPRDGNTAKEYYWFRSPSLAQWLVGSVTWWTLVGLTIAGLAVAVAGSDSIGSLGRVAPLQSAVYGTLSMSTSASPSSPALVAGLPQLGLALLYLLADAHLSVYFLSFESSLYVGHQQQNEQLQQHQRRPLRVSHHPRGHQTASLYLTLPQLWNWLLLILFAGLSFVLGQGVIVTSVRASTNSADFSTVPRLTLLGFSGVGLLVFFLLLLALAAAVLGLGGRRSPPPPSDYVNAVSGRSPPPFHHNPLTLPGGSCSAVISARCHPMPEEMAAEMTGNMNGSNGGPLPLWLRPLAWGAVPAYHHAYQGYNRRRGLTRDGGSDWGLDDGNGTEVEEDNIDAIVGHCTYSSGPLLSLETSQSYA